jgi:predicted O-linked N-acetylglucosamine transferase (SPINDLY family)
LATFGLFDQAEESILNALRIKPDYIEAWSNLLRLQLFRVDQPAAELFSKARQYGELVARRSRRYSEWPNTPEPERRLRVAFVSGDLWNHPVGHFVEGVLGALRAQASDRIELVAYATHTVEDEVTARIKAMCHRWQSAVTLTDEEFARRIRADGIDILIDLSGHTAYNRLPVFAWKPVPVQATWLGYLATTGVREIDYVIADAWTLPPGDEANFTESIWRLPDSYLCFTPPAEDTGVGPLPAVRNGHVTFGSFNNLSKMNDSVVTLWARVMHAVPDSRLFLKSPQFREPSVHASVRERFARHGIADSRLALEKPIPRTAYLSAYHRLDIALDPFPYPGITTSVESLWMGVPVLTLAGDRFNSRQGMGLLMNAGLPDWIAADADDYVAKAAAHAGDLPRLEALRSGLRAQVHASPFFDAPRFAGNFEAAVRSMWRQWCAKQPKRAS